MKSKVKVITTDAEIDAALRPAKQIEGEPRVLHAKYLASGINVVVLELTDGSVQAIRRDKLQGLQRATVKQLGNIEIVGNGTGIHWPDLDVGFYVPSLLRGIFGTKRWMSEIGRQGGSAKSDAKCRAARVNGAKGGRPRRAHV